MPQSGRGGTIPAGNTSEHPEAANHGSATYRRTASAHLRPRTSAGLEAGEQGSVRAAHRAVA